MFFNVLRKRNNLVSNQIPLSSGKSISIILIRNQRARRYVLRLRPDGSARVTIPRGGSATEARNFVERNKSWLEQQLQRRASKPGHPVEWQIGMEILFRGETVKVAAAENDLIQFGSEQIKVVAAEINLRPAIEKQMRSLASRELPPVVFRFAALHQLTVNRVTVRNQRSRWGSCSRRGTISLNWRLIQAPPEVRDYIVLHELMHLRQMNHSPRFWAEVERVCPNYEISERWLKEHAFLLK